MMIVGVVNGRGNGRLFIAGRRIFPTHHNEFSFQSSEATRAAERLPLNASPYNNTYAPDWGRRQCCC